ncbi:MAG TPA: iron ABC transporter permease [Candidatus Binatia bacterium]
MAERANRTISLWRWTNNGLPLAKPAEAPLRRLSRFLPVILPLLVLTVLVVYPLAGLVGSSFLDETGFTIGNYTQLLSTRFFKIMVNTVILGLGSALLATAAGTIFAWLCVCTDLPFRKAFTILHIAPYGLPTIAAALAWIFLLTPKAGLFNQFLMWFFGLPSAPFNILTMPGMIWALATHLYPWAFLLTSGAFATMDRSLEDAARMSGASEFKTFRKITIPLVAPSVAAAFMLVFTISIEQFSIGGTIGVLARIPILPVEIYRSIAVYPPEWGFATTLSVVLLLITSLLIYGQNKILAGKSFVTVTGKETMDRVRLGNWRWVAFAASTLFVSIAVILPYVGMIMVSLSPALGVDLTLSNFTFKHYVYIFTEHPFVFRAVRNSFLLAISAATLLALFTLAVAVVVKRSQIPGRGLLAYLTRWPVAIPGSVISVSLLYTYIRPPLQLIGTIWILLLAYLIRNLPYAYSAAHAGLSRVDPTLEEAARIHSTPPRRTFFRIIVPLTIPSVMAGWVIAFINSLRELPASLLLFSPGNETISVAIYEMFEEGAFQLNNAAALMTVLSLVTLLPAIIIKLRSRETGN